MHGKDSPPEIIEGEFLAPAISDDDIDHEARRDREARLARDRASLEDPRSGRVHDLQHTAIDDHDPRHFDEHGVPLPRSFQDKMLGVGFWGWARLGLLCLVAGAILEAGGVNPFAAGFTWGAVPAALGQGVINVFTWSVGTAWRPLLFGAIAIIPIWLVWRLLTVPFRH